MKVKINNAWKKRDKLTAFVKKIVPIDTGNTGIFANIVKKYFNCNHEKMY